MARVGAVVWLAGGEVSPTGGERCFVLRNELARTVSEVYVSPSTDRRWGADVLVFDQLPVGGATRVVISAKAAHGLWDLKVIDDDDEEFEWHGLDLWMSSSITLRCERDVPTAFVK